MTTDDVQNLFSLAQSLTRYLDPQHSLIIWVHLSATTNEVDDITVKKYIFNQLFDILKTGPRLTFALGVLEQSKELDLTFDISDVEEAHQRCRAAIDNPSEDLSKLLDVLDAEEIQQKLNPADRIYNATLISTESEVPMESLHQLYTLAQLHYNMGEFEIASKVLEQYLSVCTDPARYLATMWGLLAAYNMEMNLAGTEQVLKLSEVIESTTFSTASHALMQRCWLLHWSLFSFFRSEIGIETCLDLFLRPLYLNAIETECPWLLRYLVVASGITGKNMTEVAKLASLQKYHLSDPFCSFFEALFVDVDFQKVSEHIREIEAAIYHDFFLFPIAQVVIFSLKKLVFNEITTLFTRITLEKLAFFMGESAPTFDVTHYLNPDQTVEFTENDSVLNFPAAPESRREVLGKLDKILQDSSNITASIFKQERK